MLDYKERAGLTLKIKMKMKSKKTMKSDGNRKTTVKAKSRQVVKASIPEAKEMAPGTPARKPVTAAALEPDAKEAAPAPAKPGRIILQLVKPGAASVFVAGSFNEWNPGTTQLKPLGNGRWAGSAEAGPGRYEYLFVVDGNWIPDPDARESVANPFGGINSVLVV